MDSTIGFMAPSIPLPAALAESLVAPRPGLLKRERTRLQLVQAAIKVFSARGYAAATMLEIAAVAGMTTGTVYNHFKTKEELAGAVALWLADTLCQRISGSQAGVAEGAQRMAIGIQRYIWLAHESPAWALLMLDVAAAAPSLLLEIQHYALADMRLGIKQKSFRVPSEAAAMDVLNGAVTQAMRSVAIGGLPAAHGREVATCLLRAFGMEPTAAKQVACRPLPPFPALADAPVKAPGRAKQPRKSSG
ncbi:TetR/AcrR family transcriptional regulator [Variovorax sp. DXTD-1]|uniref:TetR/AcrR family transcriptional regulator n=1 Tax=Variovorax sp. DXTD-1 TaxID=2495592 RepID=UPI000F883FE5|nr:TetR/AcrR family transcriptional regulator [Variovorax sp. DXTD-1]RST46684.1 TetR/AcrR family transcriptional regulator [Variovorax sp. DXTD-1]